MAIRCSTCGAENEAAAQFCDQCGRQLSGFSPVDPLIGQLVADRYLVLRSLEEGGMSSVYVADQRLGRGSRDVALKVLKVNLARDDGLGERFAREVELLGQLQHPNTIRIFDYGELPDGRPFMAMEFVVGEPLAAVIAREAPLEPDRVEQIAIQIASALQEAHERGIVHRDLKPHNVMLGHAGAQTDFVKVLDFGIARRVQGHELGRNITMQGAVVGTPPYMAPEQFDGRPVDQRADVYALGVMLYELYTGELPFAATTAVMWATQHLTVAPKPLEAFSAGARIPEHSRRAVMRALEKSPGDRPASMIELLRELTARDRFDSRLSMTDAGQIRIGASAAPAPSMALDVPTVPGLKTLPRVLFGCLGVLALGLFAIGVHGVASNFGDDEPTVSAVDAGDSPATLHALDASNAQGVQDAAASHDTAPPIPEAPPMRYGFQSVHHVSDASDAQFALGEADDQATELRSRGLLTLEIARGKAFEADGSPDADLFVIVLDGSGPFRLETSEDHHHFDVVVARASGSVALDLDDVGVLHSRYVRIRALGAKPVLIDAVEAASIVPED